MIVIKTEFSLCQLETTRDMIYAESDTEHILIDVLKYIHWSYLILFTPYLQIQDFIIENIVSLQVKGLPDLLQSSSVIGSAIQETEKMSSKSLVSEY